jgi:hypothetical protein
MERNRLTADQYTRKHRINDIMSWEMALEINIQQRVAERDLMSMATDEFECHFSKTQEAHRMWAAAEEFERFKMKYQNIFRNRSKTEPSGDCYATHSLNVAWEDLYEDSDNDGKLDVGESDEDNVDDEGHAEKDDSDNGLS